LVGVASELEFERTEPSTKAERLNSRFETIIWDAAREAVGRDDEKTGRKLLSV